VKLLGGKQMNLVFEKNLTNSPDGLGKIRETFRIFVTINAVSKDEEKIGYAVKNMAYSIGYKEVTVSSNC